MKGNLNRISSKNNQAEFSCLMALFLVLWLFPEYIHAQKKSVSPISTFSSKKISPNLFGLFFEDINYAADGGLYAELIQNRSFEYSPTDRKSWHSLTSWEYITPGYSYGSINVESSSPLHPNNPHYVVLHAEHIGQEGVGILNKGYENMIIKSGEQYLFSMFARQLSATPVNIMIRLQDNQGMILDRKNILVDNKEWKKYTLSLTPSRICDSTALVILAVSEGTLAMDVISLFPEKTFRNHPNGLRADLAQVIADMKPSFMRFPGGCLVHGDGVGNMYRWKTTIGPIEQRIEQKNIWGYHQTVGLGYYEYFQFCEDIGARPVPVLPAAVSCQNSGGTWRIGGTGQQAIPMADMDEYIQEVLDLIEWANGPETSAWGSMRAQAGHPAPFNLQFIGIGNEDKMSPEFESRFKMIFENIKTKHPEVTIIGTVGPDSGGNDFEKGWQIATKLQVPMIDEHYYKQPDWFMANLSRYDSYDRKKSSVYLGEYASWGNKLKNALAEAAYMTGIERNGDIVSMASYAPMLAKKGFTQWKTDMIFFDNANICLTPNYFVQKLFSTNHGDALLQNVILKKSTDTALAYSAVQETKSGDIILKFVNAGHQPGIFRMNLSAFKTLQSTAEVTVLKGDENDENTFEKPGTVTPITESMEIKKIFEYPSPGISLTVFRIKTKP